MKNQLSSTAGGRAPRAGILRALRASWRDGAQSERIDVRRGDQPYERVVGGAPVLDEPPGRAAGAARPPDEQTRGSR